MVGVRTFASLISMFQAAAVYVHDKRHVLPFGRNVEVKLLLRPAPINIRNVGNPGDTICPSGIWLLSHRANLCICGRDRCKKTANENRRRIKNRAPSESGKVPIHKITRGRELVFLLLPNSCTGQCIVKVAMVKGGVITEREGMNRFYRSWITALSAAHLTIAE